MTYQDDPKYRALHQEYGLTFPVLLEETGTVGGAYQMRSLPSTYFIDRAGIIQEVVIGGPMSEALLRTRIEQILK
jgi:peroxiredoxin